MKTIEIISEYNIVEMVLQILVHKVSQAYNFDEHNDRDESDEHDMNMLYSASWG